MDVQKRVLSEFLKFQILHRDRRLTLSGDRVLNKIFGFGGDTGWPTSSTAYAIQARRWLTRALQAEVDEKLLSESQAIDVAIRLMRKNQEACFDIDGARQAVAAALQ